MSLSTVRNIFGRLFDTMFGSPERFDLEHRLFNACSLTGAVTIFVAGVINLFVKVPMWLALFPLVATPTLAAFYYFGRWRDRYRVLVWPLVLFVLASLAANWIGNGGSLGPITMFFIVGGAASFLLVRGFGKMVMTLAYLGVLVGLFSLEYHQDSLFSQPLIRPYASKGERFGDLVAGSILCLILAVSILHVIGRNFRDLFEKLQDYKTHFYEDLVLARILQRRIYEFDPVILEGFNHALVYRPSAELSGDLYDFSREDDTTRVFLADSKGHGINSSLSAMIIKSEWMSLNRIHLPPAAAMAVLNERIMQRYGDSISFSAVIVDIAPTKIRYASAGHVAQYVREGRFLREIEATGVPVGLIESSTYNEGEVPFGAESQLVLFTDALVEETDRRGKPVGHEWLVSALSSREFSNIEDLASSMIGELARQIGQKPETLSCRDDLTIIALART